MTAKQIQALNTGDRVKYAGQILEIENWKCHKDIVMLGSERIFAEPIFKKNKSQISSIHSAFWGEIEFV